MVMFSISPNHCIQQHVLFSKRFGHRENKNTFLHTLTNHFISSTLPDSAGFPSTEGAVFLCSTKRHFWPYWRNSIAQLWQICWLLWCKSLFSAAACQTCLVGWRSGVCGGLRSTVELHSKNCWRSLELCNIRRRYSVAVNRWMWRVATLR